MRLAIGKALARGVTVAAYGLIVATWVGASVACALLEVIFGVKPGDVAKDPTKGKR